MIPRSAVRQWKRLSSGRSPVASLGVLLIAMLMVAACTSKLSPQKAIVGKWVNAGGGSIEFFSNGTGFVPGVQGQIPPYDFTYIFRDETHIELNVAGQTGLVVEIKIDGDQMAWISPGGGTQFVYTRAK